MLGQENEAIIWADKALQVNSKDRYSLFTKGNSLLIKKKFNKSLRVLKEFEKAIEVIEQNLRNYPNSCDSLWVKGQCLKPKLIFNFLQDQNKFLEALIIYEQILKINPNHRWTQDSKIQCIKALKNI